MYLLACVPTGTLIEAIVYTALDEHDHINISEQLKFYAHMF